MAESLRSVASFDEWDRREGTPGPMGVTWIESLRAWNFALYSRRAAGVTLLAGGQFSFSGGEAIQMGAVIFRCPRPS